MEKNNSLILVVDDEPMSLQMLKLALEKHGYDVVTAENGREAIDKASEAKPDVILLDLYMPQMNGVAVCRQLKNSPASRDIPVIALTAHASEEIMMLCLEAGANEFLAKPIDHTELFLRVKNLLQIRQCEIVIRQNDLLEQNRLALEAKNRELATALEQLKQAQLQIIQQEKLASIGQLAAGIMHEINSPITFVTTNLHSLKCYAAKSMQFADDIIPLIDRVALSEKANYSKLLDEIVHLKKTLKLDIIAADLNDLIAESVSGMERMERIVQDLKKFSRTGKTEHEIADINEGIESILKMAHCELKYKATIHREYGVLPKTTCNIGQLNQVFMNLLVNAGHALEKPGQIGIRTWSENDNIYVAISDTGCGIDPEILDRIFDPFFTSKKEGDGTGLGLSIAMDIIRSHSGDLMVDSEPGRGSTFTVRIPVR